MPIGQDGRNRTLSLFWILSKTSGWREKNYALEESTKIDGTNSTFQDLARSFSVPGVNDSNNCAMDGDADLEDNLDPDVTDGMTHHLHHQHMHQRQRGQPAGGGFLPNGDPFGYYCGSIGRTNGGGNRNSARGHQRSGSCSLHGTLKRQRMSGGGNTTLEDDVFEDSSGGGGGFQPYQPPLRQKQTARMASAVSSYAKDRNAVGKKTIGEGASKGSPNPQNIWFMLKNYPFPGSRLASSGNDSGYFATSTFGRHQQQQQQVFLHHHPQHQYRQHHAAPTSSVATATTSFLGGRDGGSSSSPPPQGASTSSPLHHRQPHFSFSTLPRRSPSGGGGGFLPPPNGGELIVLQQQQQPYHVKHKGYGLRRRASAERLLSESARPSAESPPLPPPPPPPMGSLRHLDISTKPSLIV